MAFDSFERLIQSKYYNEIFNSVNNYIYRNNSEIYVKSNLIDNINFKKLDDFSIKKVLSRMLRGSMITSELQIGATLEIKGNTKFGYESDSTNLWLKIVVSYKLNDGIKDFRVLEVAPYDNLAYKTNEQALTDDFVPYIKANKFDEIAESILRKYYPQALQLPMPLPINEYLSNIGLTKIEAKLTKDGSIFGEMVFKDTEVEIFDGNERRTLSVKKKTILVDPDVICLRNQGSYNNTVVHESVHWILHKYHNEYKMLFDNSHHRSSSRTDRSDYESSKWSSYDWMEWQANGIAARILMPKRTTKQKIQELFLKYTFEFDENKRIKMFEQVIEELSSFFQVSKLAVKIRLEQLGYTEFDGIYNYVGNEYIKSYAYEVGAIKKGQTFTIAFNEACKLNAFNPKFRDILNTGRFVYVDSHYCLNDYKYVKMVNYGQYQMTDYAYAHMDECCLVFDISYQTNGKLSYNDFNDYILYRGSNPNLNIKVDFSECLIKIDRTPEYNGDIFGKVSQIMEQLPGHFCGTMVAHRRRRKYSQETLEELSTVSVSTIRRMETDKEYQKTLEKLMAICIGLKLYPDFSFDLIKKSNCNFDDTILYHGAYKMLLRDCYHLSVDECNQKLEELQINKKIG